MVKIYPGEWRAIDLAYIGMTPGVRTSTTPFGAPAGGRIRYLGRSVAWKGLRGEAFWSFAEAYVPKGKKAKYDKGGLAKGLRKAIELTKSHTEKGVSLVVHPYGYTTILPTKVVRMMEDAKKPVKVLAESGHYHALIPAAPMGITVPIL